MNIKEEIIIETLKSRGYDKNNVNYNESNDENTEENVNMNNHGFEYLLRLQVRTFTENKVRQLNEEITNNWNEINEYKDLRRIKKELDRSN